MSRRFFSDRSLLISILIVLGMAATEAPLWVSLFAAVIIIWKWMSERLGFRALPRAVTGFLSVLLLVQVYLQYKTLVGQEASNTFLIGLVALKIMDYASERDHRFLVMLGFMMIATKAVFSVDLYWLAPSLIAFIGLWSALLPDPFRGRWVFLSRLFLFSAPLALLLFLVFPRFVLPWSLSRGQPKGLVGLSDRMDPGSISEIAQVDQIVFRAKFPNTVQSVSGLYWRGLVLTQSNGLAWEQPLETRGREPRLTSEKGFRYEVMLEPAANNYLFTLNYPKVILSDSMRVLELEGSVFRSFGGRSQSKTYQVVSDDALFDQRMPDPFLRETPPLKGRVKKWVEDVRARERGLDGRLRRLQSLFEEPRFVYTLRPGAYPLENALEEFLFSRGRGFCEHFAGAYATLARALGVPARVVVGYHGGTFNLFGDFWRVSQKDAHAWAEIYRNGRWELVDPTSWIAPLRLNIGAESFFGMSLAEQERFARRLSMSSGAETLPLADALSSWIENLNYRWTVFVLDFDQSDQREFWASLTKDFGAFIVIASLFSVFGVFLIRRLRGGRRVHGPLEKLVLEIISWGKTQGIEHSGSTPPLVYMQSLQKRFGPISSTLREIASSYDLAAYGGQETDFKKVSRLRKEWKKFQLRSKLNR